MVDRQQAGTKVKESVTGTALTCLTHIQEVLGLNDFLGPLIGDFFHGFPQSIQADGNLVS
jgi:hypothetical protein